MASTGSARLDALEDDFGDCADELIGLRRRTTAAAAAARATWGRAWARDIATLTLDIATLTLDDYLDSKCIRATGRDGTRLLSARAVRSRRARAHASMLPRRFPPC